MEKTTSKVLENDVNSAYDRWELPSVNGSGATAKELQSIQQQAYNEGFALGQKDGFEQKKQELEMNAATMRSIIEILSDPLKDMDDNIVHQLSELSMAVAKQVIRRELHTEQGEIVGIVREAMNALPATTRKITLNIHPEDAVLVRNAFSLGDDDASDELRWKVIEDPIISRGVWVYPTNIYETKSEKCSEVYTILLDNYHTFNLNGSWVIGIGHNYKAGILAHDYFGSDNIIKDLMKHNDWHTGIITITSSQFERDYITNEICGINTNTINNNTINITQQPIAII